MAPNSTLFFCFCFFVFVKCIFVLHGLVTQRYTTYASACWGQTSCQVIPDLAESSSLVFWQFMSARQTTLRTVTTCSNVFVLPRAMILTIGQISFFGWNSYIPRTLLLWISYRMVGSCSRPINILKPKEIYATFVINKFLKSGRYVY